MCVNLPGLEEGSSLSLAAVLSGHLGGLPKLLWGLEELLDPKISNDEIHQIQDLK